MAITTDRNPKLKRLQCKRATALTKADELTEEIQHLQKRRRRLEDEALTLDRKIKREQLRGEIGGDVRYFAPVSQQQYLWTRGAVAKLKDVKVKRATLDYGERGCVDVPIEHVSSLNGVEH